MRRKQARKTILNILDEQIFLYSSFLKISYEQVEAIKDNNVDKILELVEKKESLIKSIKKLDKNEFSYQNISEEYCESLPSSAWDDIEDRLDELNKILNNLVIVEEANQKKINQKVSSVKGDMKTLRKGQAAYRTYVTKNVGAEALFFDNKR